MEQQTKKNQVVKNEYDAAATEKLIREIHKALLNWYDFRPDSRILYIGEEDSYAEVLKEYADQMIHVNCDKLKQAGSVDSSSFLRCCLICTIRHSFMQRITFPMRIWRIGYSQPTTIRILFLLMRSRCTRVSLRMACFTRWQTHI